MVWLIRSDDVYLTALTDEPWWGPRDEAKRFPTLRSARRIAEQVRAYPGTYSEVVVVRVVPKTLEAR